MENTKHTPANYAVMNVRKDKKDELDYFPTPGWATRALIHQFSPVMREDMFKKQSVLEPSCGAGHMSRPLEEYFGSVRSVDIHDHGYGEIGDFIETPYEADSYDWVITNPPFKLAQEFIIKSLGIARVGVAMLVRTSFLESTGRYKNLFVPHPPHTVYQFSERVPMVKNRVDKAASTATSYCWILWLKGYHTSSFMAWIPPCRKELEKDSDYV